MITTSLYSANSGWSEPALHGKFGTGMTSASNFKDFMDSLDDPQMLQDAPTLTSVFSYEFSGEVLKLYQNIRRKLRSTTTSCFLNRFF